jgi:hypothetical protein
MPRHFVILLPGVSRRPALHRDPEGVRRSRINPALSANGEAIKNNGEAALFSNSQICTYYAFGILAHPAIASFVETLINSPTPAGGAAVRNF